MRRLRRFWYEWQDAIIGSALGITGGLIAVAVWTVARVI